ncbi:MAG TPA: TolC family protein [Kiritimatiellia bacterium]|nr:TolC family protein [Kiritimatiellia bacterium]HRZ13163.1 TolC family protein [Kiritimatiellia bacterium]HSA17584.1 TolC family protein [Kiritimatiellia bacterium]
MTPRRPFGIAGALALALLALEGPAARGGERPDEQATLDAILQRAFRDNPGLKAMRQKWAAADERVPQAKALDDPQLSYEYFLEQKDVRWQAALTQMIPLFGRRGWMAREASAEARAARHEYEAARLDLYDRVSRAFYDYHLLGRSLAVMEEQYNLLADLENVIRSRYEAGSAGFPDLTKAQVEKDRTASELASMRDERGVLSDRLSALLDRPAGPPLPWPAVEPSASALLDEPALLAMIEDLNPELKAAQAMTDRARATQELARRRGRPDLMLGAGVMSMPSMEGGGSEYDASVMVGITLPWWRGKNSAGRREAAAMAESARNEQADRFNELKTELRMAVFKVRDSERRIALFRDSLIPRTEEAYAVARQAFAAGRAEFMDVNDVQRMLLEFRLAHERALVERELALVEIGCCIGKYGADLESVLAAPPRAGPGPAGGGAR